MVEKEERKSGKDGAAGDAGKKKTSAGKASAGAGKAESGKQAAAARSKRGAAKERPEEKAGAAKREDAERAAAPEGVEAKREEAEREESAGAGASRESEERMSEEEFRRLVEESLEKVTVAEVALTMMNQLASMGYLKMGLPESVNRKYRDLEQAALAIDLLEALIKGGEGRIPEDSLRPFRGTLANLQMNFVQLRRP